MSQTISTNGAPLASKSPAELRPPNVRPASRGGPVGRRRAAQPYDTLLWRLQARQTAAPEAVTLGLIGCESRAGVTTIAANLAVRASELGFGPVLLVEMAGERSRLAGIWKLPGGPGLAELLAGEASFSECLRQGPAGDLHVMPAAGSKRLDEPLWDAGAVDALLAEARADYRLVLFDLPPADQLHHAVLLARRLDQALLVVRAERSRGPAAQRAADRLIEDGVPMTGAVLNRQRGYVPRWLQRWI